MSKSPIRPEDRKALERGVGHKFKKLAHLATALTHRSYHHEARQRGETPSPSDTNERLEFLGDAVLDLVITEDLILRFPDKSEGELSKLRASLVQEKTLAQIAREVSLDRHILLGEAEARAGGRAKPSILADAYEAVLGAIYLDSGLKKAQKVILAHFGKRLESSALTRRVIDHKTRLQEITQAGWKKAPRYRLVTATGPDHQKIFEVECLLDGEVLGTGTANSKKEASQKAAREAIRKLKGRKPAHPAA